jgi:hypothetical protein
VKERRTELRIAVPSLERAIASHAETGEPALRLPAAEWLIARGRRAGVPPQAWREWLLDDSALGPDVLERFPAGPCVHAAWTGQAPRGTWACVAPVHLTAAIDHLQLAAPAPLPLGTDESEALLASLNDQLTGTGFRLHAFADRGWLCECPPNLECAAVEPAAAVGRNLRALLPAGKDGAQVCVLVNELQMRLHEHPVNERREVQGAPTVNSLWLWGFGAVVRPHASVTGALLTDDDWLAGLWRLHGGEAAQPAQLEEFVRKRTTPLRVGLAPDSSGERQGAPWRSLDEWILATARSALRTGAVNLVSLYTGAAAFDVPRRARWRFWRAPRPIAQALS